MRRLPPLWIPLVALLAVSGALAAEPPHRLGVGDLLPDDAGLEPEQLAWLPDGSALTFLRQEVLWRLDATSGELARLARPADLLPPGEELESHHWSPRGDRLLLRTASDLFLYTPASPRESALRRLTQDPEPEEDPKFSPDGSRVAFVRRADLWVLGLDGTAAERRLTSDGDPDLVLNGKTDWVYWEEIWNRDATGFWWSPDGGRLAYYRFAEAEVGRYPLTDEAPTYPEVTWQRYPKAGEANPEVRVGVVAAAGGETTWLSTGHEAGDYLARVDWAPDGRTVAVQRLDRGQTRLDLLLCGAADGRCRQALGERHPTWVNLGKDFRWLPDGGFLWASEASGWRRLAHYGADLQRRRVLTPDGWAIAELAGVTGDGRVVMQAFETSALGPAERHLLRVRLADGAVERLTSTPGTHAALLAEASGAWLHTWSDADAPTRREVVRPDASVAAELPAAPLAFDPAALPRWEFFTIPGPEGAALPARLLRPEGFVAGRRYPAIVYHYGGPGSQVVTRAWDSRGRGLFHKMMAQRGFFVISVDDGASLFFGKAGEDRLHRAFGPRNLAAQEAAVAWVVGQGSVDPARVGLWGWSGGGMHTLWAILNRPGLFRAAVAGAPVTDWRLYDSIWTERYLDRPQENPEGYRSSSPLTHAQNLRDALLIVHGTGDDNVHPQNTIVFVKRLVELGLPCEQLFYPSEKHALKPPAQRHFLGAMRDFFERHLGGPR
jgi:dipeptidyl-peptidase-4